MKSQDKIVILDSFIFFYRMNELENYLIVVN